MDWVNLQNMRRICGGDYADKVHLLMDFTDRPKKGTPRKPGEVGCAGKGGVPQGFPSVTKSGAEFSPQAETETSGLCDDVADTWYTGDFDATWRDVSEVCQGLMEYISSTTITITGVGENMPSTKKYKDIIRAKSK